MRRSGFSEVLSPASNPHHATTEESTFSSPMPLSKGTAEIANREAPTKRRNRSRRRTVSTSVMIRKPENLRGIPTIPGSHLVSDDSKHTWRRARDSNPRYPFRYNGFQDRRFQPLTQLSAGREFGSKSLQRFPASRCWAIAQRVYILFPLILSHKHTPGNLGAEKSRFG